MRVTSRPETHRIWNGSSRSFNAAHLREALLVRGLTPDFLATAADVSRGTVYHALSGRPTRLGTARRILEVLASIEPSLRLSSLVDDW